MMFSVIETNSDLLVAVAVGEAAGEGGQDRLEDEPEGVDGALVGGRQVQAVGLVGLHDVDGHHAADRVVGQALEHLDDVEHPVADGEAHDVRRSGDVGAGCGHGCAFPARPAETGRGGW